MLPLESVHNLANSLIYPRHHATAESPLFVGNVRTLSEMSRSRQERIVWSCVRQEDEEWLRVRSVGMFLHHSHSLTVEKISDVSLIVIVRSEVIPEIKPTHSTLFSPGIETSSCQGKVCRRY